MILQADIYRISIWFIFYVVMVVGNRMTFHIHCQYTFRIRWPVLYSTIHVEFVRLDWKFSVPNARKDSNSSEFTSSKFTLSIEILSITPYSEKQVLLFEKVKVCNTYLVEIISFHHRVNFFVFAISCWEIVFLCSTPNEQLYAMYFLKR